MVHVIPVVMKCADALCLQGTKTAVSFLGFVRDGHWNPVLFMAISFLMDYFLSFLLSVISHPLFTNGDPVNDAVYVPVYWRRRGAPVN